MRNDQIWRVAGPMDFFDSKIAEEAVNAAGKIIGFCKDTISKVYPAPLCTQENIGV